MVVIVLIMSVTVFAFYSGVFSALLVGVGLHPENFTAVAAGAPASMINASAVHPSGSAPGISTSGTVCTSSNSITGTVSGVYVPPGQSCTITSTAVVSSGVVVNYGGSLAIQGGSVTGGVKDNSSSLISIQTGSSVTGGVTLYGTGSFYVTGTKLNSGGVSLNGVMYASISSSTGMTGGLNAASSGSVQVDSNSITGGVTFTNDQVVRLTSNVGSGGIHFTNDPNCFMANNSITGGQSGTCTGGSPGGDLDILNTGAYVLKFNVLYMNSQPWTGISWQLASGSTEQCGSNTIPIGPCAVFPIVIPLNTMVHLSFSWVNPTPSSPVEILLWTTAGNYLESRVDPLAGLVCSTHSIYAPREPIGFC